MGILSNWWPCFLTLVAFHLTVSVFLHRQILSRLKSHHILLWVTLGSPTPFGALSRAVIPSVFQSPGVLSYHGWLRFKHYRDIGDPDLAAWAARLRVLNIAVIALGVALFAAAVAHGTSS
jgi:hypothetical protein